MLLTWPEIIFVCLASVAGVCIRLGLQSLFNLDGTIVSAFNPIALCTFDAPVTSDAQADRQAALASMQL